LFFFSLCTRIAHGSTLHTHAETAHTSVLGRKRVFSVMAANAGCINSA